MLLTQTCVAKKTIPTIETPIVPEIQMNTAQFEVTPQIQTAMRTFTPKTAMDLLSNALPEFQRPVRQWHVDEIADYMRKKEFSRSDAIKFAVLDGVEYLIDGQHRLLAIVKCGKPQVLPVTITPVSDVEELRMEYSRLGRDMGRSRFDVIHALGLAEKFGVHESEIGLILPAVKHIEDRFDTKRSAESSVKDRSGGVMERRTQEWGAIGSLYLSDVRKYKFLRGKLKSAPVLAVALYTYKYQIEKARPFWQTVASNVGLKEYTGEHRLAEFLATTRVVSSRETFSRYVAACWNAYYEDRLLKYAPRVDKDKKISICGTPLE